MNPNFDIEKMILKHILCDKDFALKVLPFTKKDHFTTIENQTIFSEISAFMIDYDETPTFKSLGIYLKNSPRIKDNFKKDIINEIKELVKEEKIENKDFLLNETERFIQKTELVNAIYSSAKIIENNQPFNEVLGLVEKALKIKFEFDTGMSYNTSAEQRFDYYNSYSKGITTGSKKIDFDLLGGLKPKTLTLIVAPSHGGKSAAGISIGASALRQKKNVLFFSLEMPDYEIAKRFDANLLQTETNQLSYLSKEDYLSKIEKINQEIGSLVIKEYSSGVLNTLIIQNVIEDIKKEMMIEFDLIIIDYLTLMSSSRVSMSQSGGTYAYYKIISEEVHGLAKKLDKPILSFSQLNRSAYGNMDSGMESIADSLGIIQTADNVIALLSNDELKKEKKTLFKFLKCRASGRLNNHIMNFDYNFMKFYDVEDPNTQIGIQETKLNKNDLFKPISETNQNNQNNETDFSSFKF